MRVVSSQAKVMEVIQAKRMRRGLPDHEAVEDGVLEGGDAEDIVPLFDGSPEARMA